MKPLLVSVYLFTTILLLNKNNSNHNEFFIHIFYSIQIFSGFEEDIKAQTVVHFWSVIDREHMIKPCN